MIPLIDNCNAYGQWCKSHFIEVQMDAIREWIDNEEYSYIASLDLDRTINLYCFIHFVIDVEFIQDVYDLIDNENEDGERTTFNLVRQFNKEIGMDVIDLPTE